jgi:hypothetical protein
MAERPKKVDEDDQVLGPRTLRAGSQKPEPKNRNQRGRRRRTSSPSPRLARARARACTADVSHRPQASQGGSASQGHSLPVICRPWRVVPQRKRGRESWGEVRVRAVSKKGKKVDGRWRRLVLLPSLPPTPSLAPLSHAPASPPFFTYGYSYRYRYDSPQRARECAPLGRERNENSLRAKAVACGCGLVWVGDEEERERDP